MPLLLLALLWIVGLFPWWGYYCYPFILHYILSTIFLRLS